MSDRAAVLLLIAVLCGVVPIAVVIIVATLRSYTIDLHMTRDHYWRRGRRERDEYEP